MPFELLKISYKARLDWSFKFKGLIKFKVRGFEADHQFILKIKNGGKSLHISSSAETFKINSNFSLIARVGRIFSAQSSLFTL